MSAGVDYLGWRSVFWITGALIAASCVVVARTLDESPALGGARVDRVGAAVLSVAVVALSLGITRGAEWGWTSPAVVGLFSAAVVVGAGWVWWERRHPDPFVDLAVTLRPTVRRAHLAGGALGFAIFVPYVATFALVALPASTGHGLGGTAVTAGLTQVPGSVVILATTPLARRLVERRGARQLLVLAGTTMAVGFSLYAVVPGDL